MQIHHIQPETPRKKEKRIARGGKRGTTSGRGQKGQKSRAGHKIKPAQHELLISIPKKRGFNNPRKTVASQVVSLTQLSRIPDGEVTVAVLKEHKLIKSIKTPVKVLDRGSISKKHTYSGIQFSAGALKKIKEAGGSLA